MSNLISKHAKAMLFVIGACEMHKIRMTCELSKNGQEFFHKQLVDKYLPQKEEFIIIFQHLIDDGSVIFEDLNDIHKHQEMWKWFLKLKGTDNESN